MNKIIGLLMGGALAAATMSGAFAAEPMSATTPAAPQQTMSTQKPAAVHATAEHKTAQHQKMSRKEVKEIQQALNASGEKVHVDGIYGPKTKTALRQFQHKNGLKATGYPNSATLEKLKVS